MDSINKNQPEENKKDLTSLEAREKIKELAEKKVCFFTTTVINGESNGVRPMNVQKIDVDGSFWFLIANDSHTYNEITADPEVKLFFQGSAHSDFLFIQGEATTTMDKGIINDLWEPILKTWFTEGETDSRICAMKIEPAFGYYWDTKHGNMVAGLKILAGAVTGQTLDDSIEGKISL